MKQMKDKDIAPLRENMLNDQDGKCAICGTEPDRPVLDHDHDITSGHIRGVLCSQCNITEGLLLYHYKMSGIASRMDYLDWIERCSTYLKKDYSSNDYHPKHKIKKIKRFINNNKPIMVSILQGLDIILPKKYTKLDLIKLYKKSF